MPIVDVKGVGKAKFPDDMPINDIRAFLQNKFAQRAIDGQSDILAPVENIAAPYSPTLVEKIGGEAEARNVQTRMSMTPDERRAKPPWETLDVPEDELIYRK